MTPNQNARWVMLPPEYDAILALEPKAVAQVILHILRQTVGTFEYDQVGQRHSREWAALSVRDFVRAGNTSRSQVEQGIKLAIKHGYIERCRRGTQRYEYRIIWRGTK